jgi:polar amino acid transport system ATP-binding protein
MNSQSTSPLLSIDGIEKRWPSGQVALNGVSFAVAEREVVAVVGVNGCGKSTLLSVLAGLEPINAGVVRLRGVAAVLPKAGARLSRSEEAVLRAHRARVGLVFQQYQLFPHLTVGANCMMGPRFGLGLDIAEAESRARVALVRVGMQAAFDQAVTELSGGQQQRVAIARALANTPEVLLLDEPTSALDPQRTREVGTLVRELASEHATTMVVVTHDLDLAREVADRIVLLEAGRVSAALPTEQFFSTQEPAIQAFLAHA